MTGTTPLFSQSVRLGTNIGNNYYIWLRERRRGTLGRTQARNPTRVPTWVVRNDFQDQTS